MASIQSKLLNALLRLINKKDFLRKQLAAGNRGLFNCPAPPARIYKHCLVRKSRINDSNVFTLSPQNRRASGRHILYLHGGAYVNNFVIFHWTFLAELVSRTGCTITAPDYPLAPEHTCKASFAVAMELYKQLTATVPPRDLTLMGDSAGGGFALALAQKLLHERLAQPGRIILLSPWLDITLSNPDIKDINKTDPFLGIEGLQEAGRIYAGDISPSHYLLSPINGILEGLGKISVFTGSRDILVADARKLRQLASAKGIEINYYEYKEMFHAWMLLNIPESKKAKQQIIDLLLHS